jgi:uncharacterized membrane protein
MRPDLLLSFIGFVLLIVGTYSPILHPIIGNWDVYDGNKPYGMAILLVAVVGIIGTVFNQPKIIRMAAWLSLVLVIVFLLLAWLKVHNTFSWIPLNFIAKFLTTKIKFKWGWYLLFGGPILALIGVFAGKRSYAKK